MAVIDATKASIDAKHLLDGLRSSAVGDNIESIKEDVFKMIKEAPEFKGKLVLQSSGTVL